MAIKKEKNISNLDFNLWKTGGKDKCDLLIKFVNC